MRMKVEKKKLNVIARYNSVLVTPMEYIPISLSLLVAMELLQRNQAVNNINF